MTIAISHQKCYNWYSKSYTLERPKATAGGRFFRAGGDSVADRVAVLVRMPPELHARVRKAAGRDSVNAWILDAVREHLDDGERLKVSLPRKAVQAAAGKEDAATWLRDQLRQLMDKARG